MQNPNSYANEVSVGSPSDKRHQPITICRTTQGQKFDSLARKQSTNGFLKCKEESRTMLDRWVSIKLTVEELIHVISAETQAPVVEKVDSG